MKPNSLMRAKVDIELIKTDVRAFRRLDRTNAAVVRRMNVAHFEPGAIAAKDPWPKGRETAFVGQLGERVRLIHELRQLASGRRSRG